jgi:hypothetical protein
MKSSQNPSQPDGMFAKSRQIAGYLPAPLGGEGGFLTSALTHSPKFAAIMQALSGNRLGRTVTGMMGYRNDNQQPGG